MASYQLQRARFLSLERGNASGGGRLTRRQAAPVNPFYGAEFGSAADFDDDQGDQGDQGDPAADEAVVVLDDLGRGIPWSRIRALRQRVRQQRQARRSGSSSYPSSRSSSSYPSSRSSSSYPSSSSSSDSGQMIVVMPADEEGEETVIVMPEAAGRWPKGWLDHHDATMAGEELAVVARPGSSQRPVVMPLDDGLYIVAEVPEEMLETNYGTSTGFAALLAPMLIKAVQKQTAQNRVEHRKGEPGRLLKLLRPDVNPAAPQLGADPDTARSPKWLDDDDIDDWGFRR